jgi:hypothetical protein
MVFARCSLLHEQLVVPVENENRKCPVKNSLAVRFQLIHATKNVIIIVN